jgi:hypothetical protein
MGEPRIFRNSENRPSSLADDVRSVQRMAQRTIGKHLLGVVLASLAMHNTDLVASLVVLFYANQRKIGQATRYERLDECAQVQGSSLGYQDC